MFSGLNTPPLTPLRLPVTTDITAVSRMEQEITTESELRHAIARMPFNAAYDYIRHVAYNMADAGHADVAIDRIEAFDAIATRRGQEEGALLDIHAAVMQTLAGTRLLAKDIDGAMADAAAALSLLSQSPKRKDEPFLSVLGVLLHDIAIIHSLRGEYRQAERDIEKSLKVLARLARFWPERYTDAHMLAMSASTRICHSCNHQAEMLRRYSDETDGYMERLKNGDRTAADALIDSLTAEGLTFARMGKHRDAVQYFTRALKLLSQSEAEFSLRQLHLSVALGESLLTIRATREKGVHLLNTMLHKATRLQDDNVYRHILDTLANADTGSLDILGIWHKIFPR